MFTIGAAGLALAACAGPVASRFAATGSDRDGRDDGGELQLATVAGDATKGNPAALTVRVDTRTAPTEARHRREAREKRRPAARISLVIAIAFVALLAVLALFQVALACGAPWGSFAWGGQHPGTLPLKYRVASAASLVVYATIAIIALDRADIIDVLPEAIAAIGMWVVFGYLALGVLMNAISRSTRERWVMTPVALVLAVLACMIAFNGPGQ
ncbi:MULTISPECIES: hypothetical protein [unclassified Leucobacter]|uniref:hypothetical protein n=1 Tax=unclassified Leucobacter TaxID=2621730 RepID=UPI00204022DA|nr:MULTISPECIES: hypothetical protein [unclassified Leucobacter]